MDKELLKRLEALEIQQAAFALFASSHILAASRQSADVAQKTLDNAVLEERLAKTQGPKEKAKLIGDWIDWLELSLRTPQP
ncbi:MAG: hypothetical protein JKX71_07980 [Amylibacter sp.]|nr:hypothetical protein [Amylibacter sp.]